jgi:hypothetical protein
LVIDLQRLAGVEADRRGDERDGDAHQVCGMPENTPLLLFSWYPIITDAVVDVNHR